MQNEKDNLLQLKRLSSDEDFFNNVFKKSEKLISVIFYILSHINKGQVSETHLNLIKDRALKTHEASLKTLTLQSQEIQEGLISFQHDLLSLESTIRVAEAAMVIPSNIAHMLFEQLDGLQRYINNHYTKDGGYSMDESIASGVQSKLNAPAAKKTSATSAPRRRRVQIPAGDISTDAYLVHSQMTDRAERIKTVLEAKPQATIKDIAEVITDVSEKTIQRELNSLIEKGQVVREGERRWSRYSVLK